jgi:oxalate decarboxylase
MHLFHLAKEKPEKETRGGYRRKATKQEFAALNGMSLYQLTLAPGGVREPHWHANADELGFCLKGKALISFFANGNAKERFVVEKGDAFLIPSGSLHCIENIGKEEASFVVQFNHELPEDFSLSSTLAIFSDRVLGNTWGLDSKQFKHREKEEIFIGWTAQPTREPISYHSPYQYALEASSPLIERAGGSVRVARQNVWPILKRQALYSLRLNSKGMREPHWHPETAEMGYVESGRGRMSIFSPTGEVDTYEMEEGDLYFIPKAYPHHIENLGKTDLHILIFFDQPMPQDIGFTASVGSFSPAVQALFKLPPLPPYTEDLFIVDSL